MTTSGTKWRDQTAVCIASGPSLTAEDCETVRLSGLPTVAVNSSWKLARFCHAIYAGDDDWWKAYSAEIDIPAERWTCLENTALTYGINRHGQLRGVTNSGARALEWLISEGVSRILMLGFDCSIARGTHWHGDHHRTKNPDTLRCQKWIGHFNRVAKEAANARIEIINCSRETTLTCFHRMGLQEALAYDCACRERLGRSDHDNGGHRVPGG